MKRFVLYVPCQSGYKGAVGAENPGSRRLCVVLVEDDPDHAELVRRALGDNDVTIDLDVVQDGEAALRRLLGGNGGAQPHLILLDLRLPKRDGLDVLREVKAAPTLRDVPCVVLSTSEAEGDLVRARELRADGYLVKPGDRAAIRKLVQEADERRRPPGDPA
jgi:CheY-like chemotaxis protein